MHPTHPSSPRRGRFAPSPTGPLHAGSLLAALGSWLFARSAGGEWHVRIEDIDPPREVAGAADAQLRGLHRLGLHPDGPVARQSTRGALYARALERLLDQGDAFVCHCSRSALAAHDGIHRRCVAGARRRDPSIRLRVPEGTHIAFDDAIQGHVAEDVHATTGDVVLRRADGFWAYQLAVVVDDAAQGMTDVVRGADLLGSTARQIVLQQRLGLPTPHYAHLPLLLDARGHKLSKSLDALPFDDRDPGAALAFAWQRLGQHALATSTGDPQDWLAMAATAFDPSRVPRGPLAASHNAGGMDAP
ncbi:tRNA glutamyl-Q(34) synthetase GluQRS [Luteimonas yindakuii]|uniref:Glutamyl-Q tRNA(Asp) synthetase n=1 Tax=Luteimonas yindakuii TaxID=2565782 RepID=A0A4Z1R3R5_9GAMM|nr:tRNA glutamyl-Q(34) synthetase GluQRS [Luteimonas yindakuii]TKS54150.1 tRNA glutamyl-Q(34) synthetase GluQRS [Luteimonas yindakuii]